MPELAHVATPSTDCLKRRGCVLTPVHPTDSLRVNHTMLHRGPRFDEPPAAGPRKSTIGYRARFDAASDCPESNPTRRLNKEHGRAS